MMGFWKHWAKNRKGDLELDELGKLILGILLLVILTVIVTVIIGGKLDEEGENVKGIFNLFK